MVGGAHTASGAPILVADAHLEPTAPPLFHVAHFRGGDLDAAGATIPGIPVVWSGRNRSIAWASTHARAVTTDLYQEKLNQSDASLYFDGVGWRGLSQRVETLAVSGADAESLVVRSTRHGPLINDLLDREREPMALSWTGARAGARSGIASLLDVARAGDGPALLLALALHEEPPLAVVYAGRDGAAGMQVAGWIPSRPMASGLVPLPGPARFYDWAGRIAFSALPQRRLVRGCGLGDRGRQFPGELEKGGERIEWWWRSGARARRIDGLLRTAVADGAVDLREMTGLQSDVAMERARDLIALALAPIEAGARPSPQDREIAGLLQSWDGRADALSTGAAAYHVFLGNLTRRLLEPVLGEALLARYLALPRADPDQVVFAIVNDAVAEIEAEGWWGREAVEAAVRESLRETWINLSFHLGANRGRWHWGRLHELVFRSARTGEPLARGGEGLGPFAYGGSGATVNTAEYDRADPFAVPRRLDISARGRHGSSRPAVDQPRAGPERAPGPSPLRRRRAALARGRQLPARDGAPARGGDEQCAAAARAGAVSVRRR